ncbi:hypothetical protein PENDEC_c002G02343 [Penicillium decumbens]|uniref:Uncharacterized protein n=1 Tax=Penicillium decumbens TaxID=69771 RepID=A0A1V6PLN4_PENDC|nr:hypothetical protein PENDEC_c002G02343 [Penicillium decumbens]
MDASVDSTGRPPLRSHKALPRRGIIVPNFDLAQPASSDQNGTVTAAPAPPLTPPGANQEEGVEDTCTSRKTISESHTAGMLTPRRPSKPPTPDVTPPRLNSAKRPTLNNFVHVSSSSRAESFQTACESIPSDGDMETPGHSYSIASQKIRQRVPSSGRNVLNGVRAKLTYAKESPHSASQPHSETDYEAGFESFDGEWASTQADRSPTPQAGKRKGSKTRSRSGQKQAADKDTLDMQHLDVSLMREKTLRDRVQNTQELAASPSMERFREDIGWPSSSYGAPSKEDEDPDSRRLSGISSTSTVEAMIIDSPKQAQRFLRHTEKRNSLRSASSPITKSERTSTMSNADSQHRLIHKAARISEYDRRSISSDVSFSVKTANSAPRMSVERIPVVVVPERRSSLRSGPNSQVPSRHGSQRSNRRPLLISTSPADAPRQKKRTMSDSVPACSRDSDSRGRPFGRPVIPPRRSSLSAPTSRTNSRTTSLTSESLRSHTLAMDFEMQKRRDREPVSPPRHNILGSHATGLLHPPNLPGLVVSSSENIATLRPPSLPYTQWSVPSSSPGPVEIREAKAVSLFPHNNRSLLLIDQRDPVESQAVRAHRNGVTYGGEVPRAPDAPTEAAILQVDSPLKNPRPPPKPPIAKPLPPLPTQEENLGARQDGDGPVVGRWGSVRRTWAARPRSDSFNSVVRSLSMRSAKNRTAGVEMDSRLHPFWRPRGFWEDIPGSPTKAGSGHQTPEKQDDSTVVNNSLGLPQQRIIIEGPPALARRSPEMRRLFDASHASLVRAGSPLYHTRYQVLSLSRWGRRLRSMSLRNTRARLRHMRERRDERKRAARRETLKQSISVPINVVSSAINGVVR